MAFRLRTIDRTADGRQIVRDRLVEQARLAIGRAAENDIALPDLALDPAHALIELRADGHIAARALGTLGFTRDGVAVLDTAFDPARGAELGFGGYRLTVAQDDDGAVLVTIVAAVKDDGGEARRGFALAGVLPGKRRLSWALASLVLLAFLIVPVASVLWHQSHRQAAVTGDASWSPGKLSLAHHALEGQCETCHVKPFKSVRDNACTTCHQTVHAHADPLRLASARQGGQLGQRLLWAVGDAFGKAGPGACADCHIEHEGPQKMVMPGAAPQPQICSDCHGVLSEKLDTRLGDASDFGRRHPQFTPAIVTDAASRRLSAVSLDSHPWEDNGLTFAHRLHLDPRGGVARMAANIGAERGYGGAGLACKDCHRPGEDGVRFQPIQMERDCEGCHSLAYDKVGGTFRRLRHGDVGQMVADLSVADFRALANPRQRPGDYAQGRPYYSNFGTTSLNAVLIRGALSPTGVCGECHTPVMRGGTPGVMPVTLPTRFMPGGWFDHKPHARQACTSCHQAAQSSSASDLLLPGIGQCRTCHQGEDARAAPVPSGCTLCHTYHPGQAPLRNRT